MKALRMSSENSSDSFSKDRAELFEALGHPTRIKILKLLSHSSLGFSELKKMLNVDSSGLLQFHLGKLHGLVKTIEGNYALTDEGREALRITVIKEPVQIEPKVKRSITPLQIITIILAIALVSTITFSLYNNQQQNITINNLYGQLNLSNNEINQWRQAYITIFSNYEWTLFTYNSLTGIYISFAADNINFTVPPPISGNEAIDLALQYGGWNSSTLKNAFVDAEFGRTSIMENQTSFLVNITLDPFNDYSPQQIGNVTYRYVWAIQVWNPNSTEKTVQFFYLVDSSTGEVFPAHEIGYTGILFNGTYLLPVPPNFSLRQFFIP